MVCLLTPTVAARWMADRPRLRRSIPRLVSISGIYVVILAGIRPGLALGPRACLASVTLIFLQDMRSHQILSALATLVALPSYCFAQAGKAELFGTIQDPQGLAATQAKVTSEGQATGARFRSRHTRGLAFVLLRTGWESRIVRHDSGSAGSRGDPSESDQRRTGHRRPFRRPNRRPRRVPPARVGRRTICADGREARLPSVQAGGHRAAHRRPDPAGCEAGIGANHAVGGCERSGIVAGN